MAVVINGSTGITTPGLSSTADVTLAGSGVELLNNSGRVVVGQTGSVIQVVQTVKTDTFSTSSSSFVDITGLSVSITPTSSSSKILVLFDIANSADNSNAAILTMLRNGSTIYGGDAAAGHPNGLSQNFVNGNYFLMRTTGCYLDSPATTSAVTYKIQMLSSGGGSPVYVNRTSADRAATSYDARAASSITVMEIAQ